MLPDTIPSVAEVYNITDATYLGDFKIEIVFDDQTNKTVDFKPFLFSHNHPDIVKYQNEDNFKTFQLVHGNLNWNDYEMIFPISDLHEGRIS